MKQLKLKRSPLYLAILGVAAVYAPNPVMAAEFDFHGDMNNRFQAYTNQRDWFRTGNSGGGTLKDSDPTESYGEIKYRFWFTAASDDGMVKGVYATEIGPESVTSLANMPVKPTSAPTRGDNWVRF